MLYQGKNVAVKLSKKKIKMYKVTAKNGSSQEDGDDVIMTLYDFLVDYITDDLYISEIEV